MIDLVFLKGLRQKPGYIPFMGEVAQTNSKGGVKNALLTYGTDDKIYHLEQKTSGKVQSCLYSKLLKSKKTRTAEGADFRITFSKPRALIWKISHDSLFPNGEMVLESAEVRGSLSKVISFESTEQSGLTAELIRLPIFHSNNSTDFEELNVNQR